MSLMLAVVKARDAAAGLRGVRKDAGAAPDTTGNVTTADLATGGALPPAVGPRRRFRLPPEADVYAAVERAFTGYRKADTAPESLVIVHGLTIVIDRPAGFVQTREDPSGAVLWTRTYSTPYGYLPGTAGGDGDELDVFVSSDTASTDAWWFTIVTDEGVFDEYKVVLCAADEAAACAIIAAHIPARFVAPGCAVTTISQIKALLGQDQRAGTEAVEQIAKSIDRAEKMVRVKKALASTASYAGNTLSPTPELANHPALTLPITEPYPVPADVGGWQGCIFPDSEEWIAFVDVNGRTLLWTQREADGGVVGLPYLFQRPDMAVEAPTQKQVRALKAADELRYILGIVLEPEVADSQSEIYSADEIRKSAWMWLRDFRNIDLEHKLYVNDLVEVVESYVTTSDSEVGGQPVLAGTWLLGVVVKDDGMWADIKSGKLTGFSINGFSKKKPA